LNVKRGGDMRVLLEKVPNQYVFYVINGKVLSNLSDLLKCLETIEDFEYNHHVTETKNDFFNWVKDIVLDLELAYALRSARTKEEAVRIVKNRIRNLEKNIKKTELKKKKQKKMRKTFRKNLHVQKKRIHKK